MDTSCNPFVFYKEREDRFSLAQPHENCDFMWDGDEYWTIQYFFPIDRWKPASVRVAKKEGMLVRLTLYSYNPVSDDWEVAIEDFRPYYNN